MTDGETKSHSQHDEAIKFSFTYMELVGTGICTTLSHQERSFGRLVRIANTHLEGSSEGLRKASPHGQRETGGVHPRLFLSSTLIFSVKHSTWGDKHHVYRELCSTVFQWLVVKLKWLHRQLVPLVDECTQHVTLATPSKLGTWGLGNPKGWTMTTRPATEWCLYCK